MIFVLATLGIFVLLSFVVFNNMQPVEFEVEGSCNTGFVGVDFEGKFVNLSEVSVNSSPL